MKTQREQEYNVILSQLEKLAYGYGMLWEENQILIKHRKSTIRDTLVLANGVRMAEIVRISENLIATMERHPEIFAPNEEDAHRSNALIHLFLGKVEKC